MKWEENIPANRIIELTAKDYDSEDNGPPFSFSIGANAEPDIKEFFEIRGEFTCWSGRRVQSYEKNCFGQMDIFCLILLLFLLRLRFRLLLFRAC